MSFQAMTWAAQQKMPAAKKCLLYTLANYAGHDGKLWPSYQRLADDAGMSRRTVINYMREFEQAGIIRKVKRLNKDGLSDSNVWILNIQEAFQGGESPAPGSEPAAPGSESPAPGVVNELHRGSEPAAPKSVIEPVITTSQSSSASDAAAPMKADHVPYQKILDLYHDTLPQLPRVKIFTEERKRALKARWNQDARFQNLQFWRDLFEYMTECDWLMGRCPPSMGRTKPFMADFDFVISPKGFVGIVEGKYEN